MQRSLGKITVVIPGQPVRVTIHEADPTKHCYVHAYLVEAFPGNAGQVYISMSPTDDRVALTKIISILPKPNTNSLASFSAGIVHEMDGMDISVLYIDADNPGDAVIGSALVS